MRRFYFCAVALLLVLLVLLPTLCRADKVTDTFHFLRRFSDFIGKTWDSTDYCSWEMVSCDPSGAVSLSVMSDGGTCVLNTALPEAESDDILVKSISIYTWDWNCSATFTLPESWSRLRRLTSLEVFDLNGLSGTLPDAWSDLTGITSISISSTGLRGTLPAAWSGMSSLTHLVLTHCPISGTIPTDWDNMTGLVVFDVRSTDLGGTLPARWSAMQRLSWLLLSNTMLSGTLSAEWAKMTQLERLDLSNTMVGGTLPAEWRALQRLSYLYLSHTIVSGTLPTGWRAMQNLHVLDLSYTRVSGALPAGWACLPKLAKLDLRNASLGGPLPAAWGQPGSFRSLGNLHLDGNDFCGCVPDSWKSRGLLHYATANMPVGVCTNAHSCTGYDNDTANETEVQCPTIDDNDDDDSGRFGLSWRAVARVLRIVRGVLW